MEGTLKELIGRFDIYSAQRFIEDLPYDSETAYEKGKYRVSSPKVTLQRGRAMCMDAALLAAALTGSSPRIMSLYFRKKSHGVLVTRDYQTGLYGAIAKSQFPQLQFREQVHSSEEELAKSYKPTLAYDLCDVAFWFPDWLTTDKDMQECTKPFFTKRIKKFSIYYFLDTFLRTSTR